MPRILLIFDSAMSTLIALQFTHSCALHDDQVYSIITSPLLYGFVLVAVSLVLALKMNTADALREALDHDREQHKRELESLNTQLQKKERLLEAKKKLDKV